MKKNLAIYITPAIVFAALAMLLGVAAQRSAAQNQNARHPHFRLIDLGTFGGPNSFFPGPEPVARVLNNQGLASGFADTSAPDPYYPSCFNYDCYVGHAFKWENEALIDIGVLPGGVSSDAGATSANGSLADESQNGLIDPMTGLPEVRAVIWTQDGHIIDLKTFGGDESFATDINDIGQVSGMAENKIPDPFSFIGANQGRAFLWDGVLRDLGTLGGPDSFGLYINDRGQVAGISYTDSTANASTGFPTIHPFLWENGYMRDLGSFGGLGSSGDFNEGFSVEVNGLNAWGEVVGTSPLAGDETHHAFLWNGFLKDLGTLGGANSQGWWVSDSGLVVGRADFSPESANHHAFLWRNDVMTDLGTLGPCLNSTALVVNSSGQVVGDTGDCPGGGDGPSFFSENGQPMVDINSLVVPGSDIEVVNAVFINEQGEVAGQGMLPNGDVHAVLLIPATPEEIAAANARNASRPTPTAMHALIKNAESSGFGGRFRTLNTLRQMRGLPK